MIYIILANYINWVDGTTLPLLLLPPLSMVINSLGKEFAHIGANSLSFYSIDSILEEPHQTGSYLKLFPLVKMVERHGDVLICLNP